MDVRKVASEIERLQTEAHELRELHCKDGQWTSYKAEQEVERKQAESNRLGALLQKEFGKLHGWSVARKGFSLEQLAQNTMIASSEEVEEGDNVGGFSIQHASHYTRNGLPIAITTQLCDDPKERQLDRLCKQKGLAWREITDFPSWHSPGETTLILITRAGTAKAMEGKA